ncbi:GINS complex subunit 4 [Fasciola hepatica]|uniref:GINS complex subunit 4 n=1 Tax=Fasciola hepatica TaxID=6192 RepID=A0A4E0RIG8_FASHE|nr:GINS complex subunit 4 [Fasciola hepatica]
MHSDHVMWLSWVSSIGVSTYIGTLDCRGLFAKRAWFVLWRCPHLWNISNGVYPVDVRRKGISVRSLLQSVYPLQIQASRGTFAPVAPDLDEIIGDSDTENNVDEELLTPAELIRRLYQIRVECFLTCDLQIWQNEKAAPILLSAHPDLLGLVQSETDRLNTEAKTLPAGDLRAQIKRMQAERIRFILTDYVRIRIEKIERFAEHILAEERARPESEAPHLTAEEFLFAKAYTSSIKEYLRNVILNRLPANMQTVKDEDLGPLSANVTRGIDSFQGHLRPIFKYFQVKSRRIKNNLSATQLKCINPRVNENTEQDQNVTTVSSDHTASGLPEQQWHESVNPHSYGKHDVTGKLSPDYFETSIHELGDANYLGQWFPCNFGRTSSQPCFADSERKESTETSRISTSPLLWSGPTCGSERVSTWTFAPNSNAKLNSSEPVFLLGLLIQPAIYIHTSGRVKYSIQIESQKLFGLIRVKNLAYEKTVTVRCSIDKWATFVDHSASYLSPLDDIAGEREYETFAFQIPMPESASQLEFAIHYEWKLTGGRSESAWDNNGDNNYVLHNRHNCGKKRMKLIQKPYQPPTPECDNTL